MKGGERVDVLAYGGERGGMKYIDVFELGD